MYAECRTESGSLLEVAPMTDVFSKAKRSQVMSLIKGQGNRNTELALIRIFRSHRITGWRRNQRVFGRPDFTFPNLRIAVFVDGCFWHQCPRHATTPKNNRAFWRRKLASNRTRDLRVNRTLRACGWRVFRLWEHELARRHECRLLRRLQKLLDR